MKFGVVCTILAALGLMAAAKARQQAPEREEASSAGAIVRQSIERNKLNEARLKDYAYTESQETRTLDRSGAVVKTERKAFDVVSLYGRPYKRLVSKDGRALAGKEKQKADEEYEKEFRKRNGETEKQRQELAAEQEKARADSRRFLQEIPKAYNFQLAGEETLEGMPVWVIDAAPRADFRSSVKRADLLKKMRGRLWIDKASLQWVRAEVELTEPISFGGFLAKLDRGARMTFLQQHVNGEVWLPVKMAARIEARFLIKHYSLATETTWSNYRKFRVDSHILAEPQP